MRLHRDILFIGVAKNSIYDGATTDGARLAENDWEGLGGALFNYGETAGLRDYETTRPLKNTAVPRHSQLCEAVRGSARLSATPRSQAR